MASYVVKSIIAVLPLKAGSERYFYRNAVVSDEIITEDGIAHALDVGLIEEQSAPELEPASEPTAEEVAAQKAEAERIAAEKAAADAKKQTTPKVPAK